MITISLEGRYVLSVDFLTEKVPSSSVLNQQISADVAKNLGKITLGGISNLVKIDPSVSQLLSGFSYYQAASIWDMQKLMKPDSLKSILNSCVKILANKARTKAIMPKEYESTSLGVKESDFVEFVVQEAIGLVLPKYKFTFIIYDKTLLKQINSSSKLKFGFGIAENKMTTFNADIFEVCPTVFNDKILVTIYGFLDSPDYLTSNKRISYTGTSIDVLRQSLPKLKLKLKTNVDKTDDSMKWELSNVRPIDYYVSLWKHSYIDKEHQICTSITTDGFFNFTDIQKKRDKDLKKLTASDKFLFKPNSFLTNFGSMTKEKYVYDIANDTVEKLTLNDTQGLVKTKINPQLSGAQTSRYAILSPDMHKNWYVAEMINMSRLYSCTNMSAWTISYQPWDYYNVTDVIECQSIYSEDCGKYLVLGKMFSIKDRVCNTYLQLGREAYSKVTGNIDAQAI